MDGAQWLALFENGAANEVSSNVLFPPRIVLRTPSLALAGQQWNNVSLMSQPVAGGSQVEAQGREINATLTMRDNAPWLAMCVISISIRPAPAARTQQRMWPPDGDAAGFPWLARSAASAARNAGCGDKNMAASMGMWRSKGIP